MPADPPILVVGAGVLGLCTTAELALRGHAVTVVDPGGDNASSIAAGMIAPALESLLEDATVERARLLKAARDLWPRFAARTGLDLSRGGAVWRGAGAAEAVTRLRGLGFHARPDAGGLITDDDWRIDAAPALARLVACGGITRVIDRVTSVTPRGAVWSVTGTRTPDWTASRVVIATGTAAGLAGLPARVAGLIDAIEPIKGQLAHVDAMRVERVTRGPGAYVVPTGDGAILGATMEAGRRDLEPDMAVAEPMVTVGLALIGRTRTEVALTLRVGVRGATADGLPLAGASGTPGLLLALAPRRNGWLMGPMVAAVVADAIEGKAAGPHAAALDPLRFAQKSC